MGKKRVAAYCRVSTKRQDQGTSIEAQIQHYEEVICQEEDWEMAGVFVDNGLSGARIENRPALLSLLKETRAGRVDRILTKSISRLSRNAMDCLMIVRELRTLGVSIYFEKENLDTESSESELFLGLFASFAEEESRSISDNCKWGIRERFRQGTYLPAVPPYGYRKVGEGVEIEPTEAGAVRRIFTAAAQGYTPCLIRGMLNAERIPAPRGGRWNAGTIRHMLGNVFYMGDLLLQKTYRDDRRQQQPNNGKLDKYLWRGHHEAIIEQDLFDTVQYIYNRKKLVQGRTITMDFSENSDPCKGEHRAADILGSEAPSFGACPEPEESADILPEREETPELPEEDAPEFECPWEE